MYKLHRSNLKTLEEDNERLTADITRIFGKIARNLLTEKENPFVLLESEIRSHKTMRKKTLRFLKEVGILNPISYGSDAKHLFKKQFENFAREYAIAPVFPNEPDSITNYLDDRKLLSTFEIQEDTIDYVGYREADKLPLGEAIYVFYNLQDYDVKGTQEDDKKINFTENCKTTYVYPKNLLVQRNKAILKMLVKKYSEMDFKAFLERKFNDNYDGQVEKDADDLEKIDFEYTLRNFARFPITFAQPERAFFSPKGYVKEYNDLVEKVTKEYNRIKKLVEGVNKEGGCTKVVIEYIKECLLDITNKAVLLINSGPGEKRVIQFIMDHRDLFTYEYIYS